MTFEQLQKSLAKQIAKLDALDEDGGTAAPIDLLQMFDRGIDERASLSGKSVELTGKKGIVVTGTANVDRLVVGTSLLVFGDVTAKSIELTDTMLVLGTLTVTGDVRGTGEPDTLSVVGKVTIGRAMMIRGYIMQFFGGGTIGELIDDNGGADELLELLGSKLEVKKTSDVVPS